MLDIISQISRNRTELMGVATIAVFSLHFLVIADIQNWWYVEMINTPRQWIFTEGFLFLSGFGCFYSLEKEDRILPFFKKRLLRLYLPFLIVAGPIISFLTLMQGKSIYILLARLTTVNFWIEGNVYSMWYVSVTMLFYFLSPFLYRLLKSKYGIFYCGFFFLSMLLILDYVKNDYFSKDEFQNYQGITQMPAFFAWHDSC